MFCNNCGSKNDNRATFCTKCGFKIAYSESNKTVNNDLDEESEGYKKIKTAGTSAESLGWFNLIVGPIIVLAGLAENTNEYYLVDLIYILIVSIIFIKYGKKLKNVNTSTMKDLMILLWTSIIVVSLTILSGSFTGWLFVLEIYYLFKAKTVLKSLT